MENYVKCPCQHCNKGIEFDAQALGLNETMQIECPHCGLETSIFVPISARPSPKREPSIKLNAIIDSGKAIVKSQNLAAGAFERIVFTAVRMFIMFWAVIIVLAFIVTTIGYIGTFFPDKPTTPDEPDQTVFTQIVNHPHWEAFVAYLSALFLLFCALTMISIVLLLLAIERNTRKSNEETRKT